MWNRLHRHFSPAPAPAPERQGPRPIEQLHPVLLSIVYRMDVMPPGDAASITQPELARAVELAISMLPDDEQAYIVSRIMTDEDMAEQRLQSLQMQDVQHHVHLSGDEIRLLRRGSPEPGGDSEEDQVENRCIVCFGQSDVSVPCGCHYCSHCLRENIRHGLRFEVDFPPRCCHRPFDEATIRLTGRPALVHLFRQLSAEYATAARWRVYCYDADCSSFIPVEDMGACPTCGKVTCTTCGARSHPGLPCREEEDEDAVLDMMDARELVGCPSCGIVIALDSGCNHITREWGRCSCPIHHGSDLRVPVRQRPGRRPIRRGGRAHLANHTETVPRIPQLRYDPDDEAILAAVDYAPVAATAPVAVSNPAPHREREPVIRPRDGAAEHMEFRFGQEHLRLLQHQLRHDAPVAPPNLLNEGPVAVLPFPRPLPQVMVRPPLLDEAPFPIPGAFPDEFLPPLPLPVPHLDRPPVPNNPAVNHPPNQVLNIQPQNNQPQRDVPVHERVALAANELAVAIQESHDARMLALDELNAERDEAIRQLMSELNNILERDAARQREREQRRRHRERRHPR